MMRTMRNLLVLVTVGALSVEQGNALSLRRRNGSDESDSGSDVSGSDDDDSEVFDITESTTASSGEYESGSDEADDGKKKPSKWSTMNPLSEHSKWGAAWKETKERMGMCFLKKTTYKDSKYKTYFKWGGKCLTVMMYLLAGLLFANIFLDYLGCNMNFKEAFCFCIDDCCLIECCTDYSIGDGACGGQVATFVILCIFVAAWFVLVGFMGREKF